MPPSGSMHTAQTAYPMTIDLREAAVKFSLCKSLVPEDAPYDGSANSQCSGNSEFPPNSFHAPNAQLI